MSKWTLTLALAFTIPGTARAQSHQGHDMPYAGLEGREIKALSDEEIASLRAGEGMGFALAAELNGVPGPKHVLELSDELGLSDEQIQRVEAVRTSMADLARRLGAELIEAERALDRAFGHAGPPAEHVASLIREAGDARTRLREAHLLAHLETAAVLTPDQIQRYAELRGYASVIRPG